MARELTSWLLAQPAHYTVYVEGGVKAHRLFDAEGLVAEAQARGEGEDVRRRLRTWDEDMCRARPHTFDFVITLGGDGTVLYASWLFQRIVPPVLSFALGSLGFLTKFDFGGFRETLTGAFRDGVSVSLRLRFEGTVMRSRRKKRRAVVDGEDQEDEEETQKQRDLVDELIGEEKDDERTHRPDGTFEVLNEIVVDRGPNPSEFTPPRPTIQTNTPQPCRKPKSSATTSTSQPSWPTACACPLPRAPRPTTSPRVAPSATPRTP